MKSLFFKKFWSLWLVIALFPLLVLLAYYQIQWAIDTGRREQRRLLQMLHGTVSQLRLAIQNEITILPVIFSLSTDDFSDMLSRNDYSFFKDRWENYKNYSLEPTIVKELFIVKLNSIGIPLTVWKWDGDRFVLVQEMPGGPGLFYFPLERGMERGVHPDVVSTFQLALIIDLDILGKRLIPLLAEQYLYGKIDFSFRIVDTYNQQTVYTNVPQEKYKELERIFKYPDIQYPLFNPDFFILFSRLPRDMNGPVSNIPAFSILKFRKDTFGQMPRERRFEEFPEIPPFNENQIEGVRWILQSVHTSGSLTTFIQRSILRNTVISIGILFILGLALMMLSRGVQKNQELAKRQQEFIASITHEFKTPLSVIRSGANNLASGIIVEPEKIRQYGTLIEKQGVRLLRMVDQLLVYSRLASVSSLSSCLLEVAEIIESVLQSFQGAFHELEFRCEVKIKKGLVVRGDPVALEIVFFNLIDNCLKHASEGHFIGIDMREEVRNRKKNLQKWVVIVFRDHGKPLPRKEQKLIFEAFYRGEEARKKQRPGSGLGLNLVRRIILAHGGTVHYEVQGNLGSAFIIQLPEVML